MTREDTDNLFKLLAIFRPNDPRAEDTTLKSAWALVLEPYAVEDVRAAVAAYVWLQALMPFGAQCPEWVHDLAQKAHFSQHVLTLQERDALVSYVQSQAKQVDYCLPFPRRLVFRYLKALY